MKIGDKVRFKMTVYEGYFKREQVNKTELEVLDVIPNWDDRKETAIKFRDSDGELGFRLISNFIKVG